MKKNTSLLMFAFIIIYLFCDQAFSNDNKYEKSTFVEELIRQHQQIREKISYNYIKINAIEYPDPYIAVDSPEYHDKTPYSAEFKTIDELHIMTSKEISVVGEQSSCSCAFSENIPIVAPPKETVELKVRVQLPKYKSDYDQTILLMVATPNKLEMSPVRIVATIPNPLPTPDANAETALSVQEESQSNQTLTNENENPQ